MAALIASSARTEQWTFTGGKDNSSTIEVLRISIAWSMVLPLSHSVARLLDAMALPHHIAAFRRADDAGAHRNVGAVEAADVARVIVMVEDLVAVCHLSSLLV